MIASTTAWAISNCPGAVHGPGAGDQACGEVGDGRMLEPLEIVEELVAFFAAKLMSGKRVLITAGPTFEAIDPVRGITNLSSGKMGYALARACRHAGAQVTLVLENGGKRRTATFARQEAPEGQRVIRHGTSQH